MASEMICLVREGLVGLGRGSRSGLKMGSAIHGLCDIGTSYLNSVSLFCFPV